MASALYLENFLESECFKYILMLLVPLGLDLVNALHYWRRLASRASSFKYLVHNTDDPIPYCAGIETLPQELQRNFTLMRSLDQRAEGQCIILCMYLILVSSWYYSNHLCIISSFNKSARYTADDTWYNTPALTRSAWAIWKSNCLCIKAWKLVIWAYRLLKEKRTCTF